MSRYNTLKQALGILIHMSELSGRYMPNKISEDSNQNLNDMKYYQSKREELKKLILEYWNDKNKLKVKLKEFQNNL